jgi:hypothetical protein
MVKMLANNPAIHLGMHEAGDGASGKSRQHRDQSGSDGRHPAHDQRRGDSGSQREAAVDREVGEMQDAKSQIHSQSEHTIGQPLFDGTAKRIPAQDAYILPVVGNDVEKRVEGRRGLPPMTTCGFSKLLEDL